LNFDFIFQRILTVIYAPIRKNGVYRYGVYYYVHMYGTGNGGTICSIFLKGVSRHSAVSVDLSVDLIVFSSHDVEFSESLFNNFRLKIL
jgi:hypothetical protein